MEQDKTFQMTYSAQEQKEIDAIRKKYAPPEEDKMAQLRALDASVGRKASRRAITMGVVGALLLGVGMSLVMSDFGAVLGTLALPLGIAVGLAGLGVVLGAYPVYQSTLKKERARVAPEILRLTDELRK